MRVFRWAHLVGIVITATVPLWNRGICPLTIWEGRLSDSPAPAEGSFIIRLLYDVLYLDVSPTVLSLVSAAGAMIAVWVFVFHPPGSKDSG
jgi:Zn-dependent protease